jgi:uncharacterized protein (TIGR03643 family)
MDYPKSGWPDQGRTGDKPLVDNQKPIRNAAPDPAAISEIIEMALSDHVSFDNIRALHGLGPDAVKALMRQTLKPGSYRAWRKRVRAFSDRREGYK